MASSELSADTVVKNAFYVTMAGAAAFIGVVILFILS